MTTFHEVRVTNLLNIPTINYGELSAEDSAVLIRIYSTLLLQGEGLLIQWSEPQSLAKAAKITEERAAAILKYLIDYELAYYHEDMPGLYLRYEALPDKFRRKYYQ